jgi:hypothetical protein
VCGILWNWSLIHHRGKSILDMTGQSFSCDLSNPKSVLGALLTELGGGQPGPSPPP